MRFEIRTHADVEALRQRWGLTDDDEPKKKPEPSSLEAIDALVVAVIDSKDAARIYSKDLIDAMGRAGTIRQFEAKHLLQTAFPKDFRAREWWARVKEAEGKNWVEEGDGKYLLNTSGNMKPNLANAETMMEEMPLAYDCFACRAILTAAPPWRSTAGVWGDNDDSQAAIWCQKQNLDIPLHVARDAAATLARKKEIHPVQEYLKALKWDGEPRLDMWLSDYMGCEDSPYVRMVASKWLIAAVNRVMEPGCQADYTLVLEGKQGKYKSTALRTLGGEWFSDDLTDIGTKDSAMQLQGNWIIEIGELDAFKRAEVTTINAWLTRRTDEFRPPYGRHLAEFPRQNVFAATTNNYSWGKDDTGLRRFWPVLTGKISPARLRKVRDQLFAEAFFRFNEGERGFAAGDTEVEAVKQQEDRQERDAWSDRIEEWMLNPTQRMSMDTEFRSQPQHIFLADILGHCLGMMSKDWNQPQKNRVTRILRVANYHPVRAKRDAAKPDGKRLEYWRKATQPAP